MADIARPRDKRNDLAIVLTGGGARAAYQVGFIRCIARVMPNLRFPIITGVSAGAINAVYLASHSGSATETAEGLTRLWSDLEIRNVFRSDSTSLLGNVLKWGLKLMSGGSAIGPQVEGLVDTAPLRRFLGSCLAIDDGRVVGIQENIDADRLKALALTTLDYTTGRTVTWVQGAQIEGWERSYRRSCEAQISLDHVMASAALPLFFPAVRLGDHWFGDGGIRLSAPLSPALHLGARRILAISTRYARSGEEAQAPISAGYPPPAQIVGNLMNAVFLDLLDQDLERAETFNELLSQIPADQRGDKRLLDIEVLRPSVDLGKLSADYEAKLPGAFRFLTRGLGTKKTKSPDYLSLVMFEPDYLRKLIEIGEADAEANLDAIERLVAPVDELDA